MTTPSFLTPCLRVQSILEAQWEQSSVEDVAFLTQHAEECPVCDAEIKEQQALIDALSNLPDLPFEQSVEDRMIASVLERVDLHNDSVVESTRKTIETRNRWAWAIAACFIGALIVVGPILKSGTTPENLPSKGTIAQQPSNHEVLPNPINSNPIQSNTIQANQTHISGLKWGTVLPQKTKRNQKPSPAGIRKKAMPVKMILVQQSQSGIAQPGTATQNQSNTHSISGEFLADSTTPDQFIWGASQPMVSAAATNRDRIEVLVDSRQREAELAVDADQNWADQGEASLVDFVGF
jgi:hypothetical protein